MSLDEHNKLIEAANQRYVIDTTTSAENLEDIKSAVTKIKISHTEKDISNIVYTVTSGKFIWVKETNEKLEFEITSTPNIYRCTIFHSTSYNISDKSFSISGRTSTTKDDGISVGTHIRGYK